MVSTTRSPEELHGSCAPKVLVCGTGSIGMRHLRVMRDYLKLDPVALPVRSSRADELRAEGFQTLAGWEEGLAFAPQAVVVATDTTRHLADATRALAAGADVLIEKPLSPTVAGIKEFAELSVASGRRVFVACNLRFDAGLQLFRKQLSEIGRIHAVRIECQSYLPSWRPGTDYRRSYSASAQQGGVLRDLIHEIDYAIWLFGPPMAVIGHVKNSGVLEIEAEESADLIWEAQSGATVSLRLDYLTHTPRRRMQAFGERGELEWDYFEKRVRLLSAKQGEQVWPIEQSRDEMMQNQASAFLGVVNGTCNPMLATLEEGALAVAVCDAARSSSASGRIESVLDWRSA